MEDKGVWLLCSFYHESLRTWIKTIVNQFAILNQTALILAVHALRSYLKLICEYDLHSVPNKKVSGAKDHGKNYIKVRPPLVRHLLRNRLFTICISVTPFQPQLLRYLVQRQEQLVLNRSARCSVALITDHSVLYPAAVLTL